MDVLETRYDALKTELDAKYEEARKMEDRLIALAKNTEIKQELEKAQKKIKLLKEKLERKDRKYKFSNDET